MLLIIFVIISWIVLGNINKQKVNISKLNKELEEINEKKQEKIVISSQIYIKNKKWKQDIRYDVIGIKKDKLGNNKINWIKNAF